MKHDWGKPCVPACPGLCCLLQEHVPNVFGFCYPLWLQLSLSFGIYDFRSNSLDSFNETFLEREAWGTHWGRVILVSFLGKSGPRRGTCCLRNREAVDLLFHLEHQTDGLSKRHGSVVPWKLSGSSGTLLGKKIIFFWYALRQWH